MTPSELAAQEYQEVGYVLFIEGWSVAFTNRAELASGGASWLGEGRTVALGLELPQSIKLAIGLVDSGMLVDDNATFTIIDRDGHLIAFNEDEEGSGLNEPLSPLDDPAPEFLVGDTWTDVRTWEHWVNGESIGPEGQRRQFQVLPGGGLPGMDHTAISTSYGQTMLRPSVVQTQARHWEGRWVALYLIRRDPTTGEWASWAEQFASGYSLLWWGSVTGLSAQAHAWKLECSGPSSWLRKTLNTTTTSEWKHLSTPLVLGPKENLMAIALCVRNAQGDDTEEGARSAYTIDDVVSVGLDPGDTALSIHQRIQALAGALGDDIVFSNFRNAKVFFDETHVSIRVDANNDGNPNGYALGAVCQVRLHKKVWAYLGWDIYLQGVGYGPATKDYQVESAEGEVFYPIGGDPVDDPIAGGYVEARFTTVPLGKAWSMDPHDVDGNSDTRFYRPLYSSQVSILYGEGSQHVDLGFGALDAPFMSGQLAKPPAAKELDGLPCDRAGFIAVQGTYRGSEEEEGETWYQLARVSWRQSSDDVTVALDALSRAVVWVESWYNPQHWGVENPQIGDVWAADDLKYVPVTLLGYNDSAWDRTDVVLVRLLLSSGTAEWSGAGDAATIAPGANQHPDASGAGNDLEIADLGLGIPQELVDIKSFAEATANLPGGSGGALNATRQLFIGPFDSQAVIEDIIKPRGLCLSLRGGRYGLFARWVALDLDDVEVAITPGDVAGEPDELPPGESVDFRPLEPVDLIRVSYGGNQIAGGDGEKSFEVKARDPRSWQRRGNAAVDIETRSLLSDESWHLSFSELWGDWLARWFADPKALVRVRVKGSVARDIWPGTVVSYTSPWPATRSGTYGMSQRVGRVISVERDLQTLAATVEILVEGKDPTTLRRYAPIARLVDDHATAEGRHDPGTRTITCYADAFGRGSGASDVAAFVEPGWSSVGGRAVVQVWQSWDGRTWEQSASFEVESVDTGANTITYVHGSLSGAIWEKRHGVLVLAPYEQQNENQWPRAVFGVHCDVDGRFGAGDEPGFPWVE